MGIKIEVPDLFLDDVIWNPLYENIENICNETLHLIETTIKIIEEFQKYLKNYKIE